MILAFRLGGTDGVSVEARKWEWALRELGFTTRRVAGELADGLRPDDTWLPFLGIEPPEGAGNEPDALAASLAGADLVVVENLCSLPLNLDASTTAAAVLADHDGRVAFHHHDLPWEREHLAHLEGFPPQRANSLHLTINELAREALADRGIEAQLIRNAFELDPVPGERDATRDALGFSNDDVVVLQPARAIPRKQVAMGIEFAHALAGLLSSGRVRYWLTGPAEDGFGPELRKLVDNATVPITEGRAPRPQDAYAAADVVTFPSSWEGFGNPVIEALIADRPVAVAWYPVLDELVALGLQLFSVDDPAKVAAYLTNPSPSVAELNATCLREHFDLNDLPARIARAFATVGWDTW